MSTKCSNCLIELNESNRSKGYRSLCKGCYAIYMKQYYKNKPEKYNVHKENYVKNNDSMWFLKAQSMVMERLVHGCMDCGEKNPVVLEFDHRIPSDKKFSISRLMRQKVNENTFIDELNKCDIVCANCHRIRSAKMFGSWRSEII